MYKTKVGIFRSEYESLNFNNLKKYCSQIVNLKELFSNKPKVLLKPNFVTVEKYPYWKVTHPAVIEASVRLAHAFGAKEIVIGEGSGNIDTKLAYEAYGIYDMEKRLRKEGIPLRVVDLNQDQYRTVRGFVIGKSVVDADVIINLPKLKSHSVTAISCAVKSFVGVCVGKVYGYPKWAGLGKHTPLDHGDMTDPLHNQQLPNTVTGIAEAVLKSKRGKRILTIADAIDTQAGDFNYPVHLGVLLISMDLVSCDVVGAKLFGYNPQVIPTISIAAKKGLGNNIFEEIEVVGEKLETTTVVSPTPYRWIFRLYDNIGLHNFIWVNFKYTLFIFSYLTDNSINFLEDLWYSVLMLFRKAIPPRFLLLETTEESDMPLFEKTLKNNFWKDLASVTLTSGRHSLHVRTPRVLQQLLKTSDSLREVGLVVGSTSSRKTLKIVDQMIEEIRGSQRNIILNVGLWLQPKKSYPNAEDYNDRIRLLRQLKCRQVDFADLRVEMHHLLRDEDVHDLWQLVKLSQILATPQVFIAPAKSDVFEDYELPNIRKTRFLNKKNLAMWRHMIGKVVQLNLGGLARSALLSWHYEDMVRILSSQKAKNPDLSGRCWLFINKNGDVYPSPTSLRDWKMGSILHADIKDIWRSQFADELRDKNPRLGGNPVASHGLLLTARSHWFVFGSYAFKVLFIERLLRQLNPMFPIPVRNH